MPQEYGGRANLEPAANVVRCAVCDRQSWSWTDLHGEAYCTQCGTPHQLKGGQHRGCNLKDEFVSIVKEYFTETGKSCGLGTFMIERDYPDQIAARREFDSWMLSRHPELCKPVEQPA